MFMDNKIIILDKIEILTIFPNYTILLSFQTIIIQDLIFILPVCLYSLGVCSPK